MLVKKAFSFYSINLHANSMDPDQTDIYETVSSGTTLFAKETYKIIIIADDKSDN